MKLKFPCHTSLLCLLFKAVVWALIFLTQQRFPPAVAIAIDIVLLLHNSDKNGDHKNELLKMALRNKEVLLLKSFVQTCITACCSILICCSEITWLYRLVLPCKSANMQQ